MDVIDQIFSLSLYVPYPMTWVIMDFHSSLSLAFSNSATFLQSIHLILPSRVTIFFLWSSSLQSFLSMPDSPNHLFSSNVPETSSALFLFLRLVSCLFQLFSKCLHFLLCLSKESSSFISKTTFHRFPNADISLNKVVSSLLTFSPFLNCLSLSSLSASENFHFTIST